jgi:hypothetical protein
MTRVRAIENRVAENHKRFLVQLTELPGQRLIAGFINNAFPDPLPKLFLRRPVLVPVVTNDQRRVFLALVLRLFCGVQAALSLAALGHTSGISLRDGPSRQS